MLDAANADKGKPLLAASKPNDFKKVSRRIKVSSRVEHKPMMPALAVNRLYKTIRETTKVHGGLAFWYNLTLVRRLRGETFDGRR